MFTITVQTEFCAAHALMIAGAREPAHGHNFRVWATVEGRTLDADGLLCDFHAVEASLREITAAFQNRDLNSTPPFTELNPSAEQIALHIGRELARRLGPSLPPDARVAEVRVSEATNCTATWKPAG